MAVLVSLFVALFSFAEEAPTRNSLGHSSEPETYCQVLVEVGQSERLSVLKNEKAILSFDFKLGYSELAKMTEKERHAVYGAQRQFTKAFRHFCFSDEAHLLGHMSELECQYSINDWEPLGQPAPKKFGDFGCSASTGSDSPTQGFYVKVKNGVFPNPDGVIKGLTLSTLEKNKVSGLSMEAAETLKNIINFTCNNTQENMNKLCPTE